MKLGSDLATLSQKIEETAKSARDFVIPAESLHMAPDGALAFAVGKKGSTEKEGLIMPPTIIANEQLSTYTGIPREYYNRMPTELERTEFKDEKPQASTTWGQRRPNSAGRSKRTRASLSSVGATCTRCKSARHAVSS